MLGAIILVMFFGFITGALARLAVPGPDPMPVWLTVAIGLAGSAAGGAIAIGIWGRGTQAIGILSFVGAVLLVVAYRRFVQSARSRARMRSSSRSAASGSTSSTSGATRWKI